MLVALLRAAIALGDALGPDATAALGAGVGRAWHALRGPRTRRVREQLAAALPEAPVARRRAWEREVFAHLGRGLAELVLLSGRHRETLLDRMQVDGLEHLEAATRAAGGRGAILIGPHLGNWELGAAKLAALGVPVAAVYRGLRQPGLERAVRRVRAGEGDAPEGGIEQIAMGPRAGMRFVRALAKGRTILVLLDQRARAGEGIPVPFFGRSAPTRIGPLRLADRAKAPVLLAFARRDPDGRHHRLTIHPPLQLEPGASDDEAVLRRNLERVTAELENEIRATPGQWIWTHRRWRAAAPEEAAD